MQRRVPLRQIRQAGTIVIKRLLPIPGEIVVEPGQAVEPDDVVAEAHLPGESAIIHLSHALNLTGPEAKPYLLKEEGDLVEVGEIIAERKSRLPFLSRICRSPVQGKISSIDGQWLLIEMESVRKPLSAFAAGIVTELLDNRGVVIETTGAYFEAACGLGGEAVGLLHCQVEIASPLSDDGGSENALLYAEPPVILAVQRAVDEAAIRNLESRGVSGLIVGSLDSAILEMTPAPAIPVVAMDGFGDIPMADDLFALFQSREGRQASICGTMLHAGQSERPLIIIPDTTAVANAPSSEGHIVAGSRIRSLREPTRMAQGKVMLVHHQRQRVLADIAYPGADVQFSQESKFVPWLNMEALID